MYYTPGSNDEPGVAHLYCEFLLGYALMQEKQLIYRNQTIIRNEWGKPTLQNYPQIQFNVSHCTGLVSCIVADVPVGIDVEYVRPYSYGAASHVLSKREMEDLCNATDPFRQFFIYWTLKESCVKAMGTGISFSMKQIVFRVGKDSIECLTQPEYQFLLIENATPYITAVCYKNAGRSVRMFEGI